jgi:hypothetical protein
MTINKVFTILDTFLQSWNEILRAAVIIEIFKAIYKICVLSKMKVLARFALFTHLAIIAVLESANERNHLLVTTTYDIFIHFGLSLYYKDSNTPKITSIDCLKYICYCFLFRASIFVKV